MAGAVLTGLVVTGAGLAACGSAGGTGAAAGGSGSGCPGGVATLTVHGHGSVEGPPDLLTVSLGVQTQAATATAALNDNSTRANALMAELRKHGVADQDLQTSGLSIQPVYSGPRPTITGYQVTNTVTARLHDLSGAGALIDDAAGAVGDAVRVDQIAFSIQDDSALAGQARAAAVRQAADQARAMAGAAGRRLGALCSLTDNTTPAQPQPVLGAAASAGGAFSAAPPIQAGTQQVTADVTAVYRLGS